jgi:hypothetical protein
MVRLRGPLDMVLDALPLRVVGYLCDRIVTVRARN